MAGRRVWFFGSSGSAGAPSGLQFLSPFLNNPESRIRWSVKPAHFRGRRMSRREW